MTATILASLKNSLNRPLFFNWWPKVPRLKAFIILIAVIVLLTLGNSSYTYLSTRIIGVHLSFPLSNDQLQAAPENRSSNNSTVALTTLNSKNSVSQRKETKRILFWTTFYRNQVHDPFCLGEKGLQRQREMCGHYCDFTMDRQLINSSHAVVFYAGDLETKSAMNNSGEFYEQPANLPSPRISSQHWILFLLEAPPHTWHDLSRFENTFNWTMSYRRDSDIYIPYGLVQKRTKSVEIDEQNRIQLLTKKPNLVAWITTNCYTETQPSQRQKLAQDLKQHVQVDIYGNCGKRCSKSNSNICEDLLSCYEEIGGKYKFYLAFENSLCIDYITEKPFNALLAGMVPIVYGHANYASYLPNNSYINAMDFKSAEDLGKYLLHLDTNPGEYLKYFEWRESHVVVKDAFYLERTWCSLCERISVERGQDDGKKSIVSNLKNWWDFQNGSRACVEPPSFLGLG